MRSSPTTDVGCSYRADARRNSSRCEHDRVRPNMRRPMWAESCREQLRQPKICLQLIELPNGTTDRLISQSTTYHNTIHSILQNIAIKDAMWHRCQVFPHPCGYDNPRIAIWHLPTSVCAINFHSWTAPVVTVESRSRSCLTCVGPTRRCSINLIHGIAQTSLRCDVKMTTPIGWTQPHELRGSM